MAEGGIEDILIAFPVARKEKLARVEQIMSKAKIILAVDSLEQASMVNHYFEEKNLQIEVWIKVNCGLDRCGVESEEAVELAKHIRELSSLSLQGIFTHAGHSYAATTQEEIEDIAQAEANAVLRSSELCEKA